MSVLDALLDRSRRRAPVVVGGGTTPVTSVPRPLQLVIGALALWTGLSGLFLLLVRGDFARLLAGGLADAAGRRLLGINLVVLAVVYAVIIARPAAYGSLGWLPLAADVLIALIGGYNVTAGSRSFDRGWLTPLAALVFALVIAGFHMAGGPVYAGDRGATPHTSRSLDAAAMNDTPTERLTAEHRTGQPGASIAAAPPTSEPPDESVLGI